MSDDFIDLTQLAKQDYSRLFLKNNPFPDSTVPEEIPHFTADRSKEKKQFRKVISNLIYDGKSSVTVYVGDYGSGKSHLMRAFKHAVMKQLFHFEKEVFPIYARTPGRNFLEFYQEIISDINRKNLELFAKQILTNFITQYKNKAKKFIHAENIEAQLLDLDDVKDFVGKEIASALFNEVARTKFSDLKNYDVLFALLFILHPVFSPLAWRWFLGAKLNKEELSSINVKNNIGNSSYAYSVLKTLMSLIKSADVNNVVLYVDEFEKITYLPSNLRASYQDDLRHLIDDFPQNMAFFLQSALISGRI